MNSSPASLLDIIHVQPDSSYCLTLTFENGEKRLFDMKPYLNRKPWLPLKARPLFLRAYIQHGTVTWPGNIDIAPEPLYNHSTPT